jgi:hypothetical protein
LLSIAKATTQTKDELKAMVERVMHRLQKMPEIVAGFFHPKNRSCLYVRCIKCGSDRAASQLNPVT